MMKNYTKMYGIKKNARLKVEKLLKTFSVALVMVLFTATSYGQCITGGNNTESVAFAGGNFFGGSVTNPTGATADADFTTTAAQLNLTGALQTATLVVNFSKPVNPGDSIYFIFGQGSGINLAVGTSTVGTAYSGTNTSTTATPSGSAIGTNSASSFLSAIIIGGTAYQALSIGVDPTSTTGAGSIQLQYSALIAVGAVLNVYGVYVVPGPLTALSSTVCYPSGVASLQATKQTIGSSTINVQWYKANDTTSTDLVQTDLNKSGSPYTTTYTTPSAISTATTYYVRQSTSGCGLYSPLVPVTATINPQILAPITNTGCTGSGTGKRINLSVAPSGGSGTLATTNPYVWVATNGGNITSATNTAAIAANANGTYTVTVTDNKGCSKSQSINITGFVPTGTSCTAVVLPAIGLTLGGSVTTGKPVLTWSTLQEVNTSYYSIEASTDGTSFTALGKVAAAGNSSVPTSYTFTDVTSASAVVYYRVKLVDVDGGVTYSNVFSLRLSGSALAKIYPNPVTNFVNIETGAPGTYVAELFTVDGRKLTSTSLSTASGLITFTINRSNVTGGVYLLKVTGKTTATSTYNTIMVK